MALLPILLYIFCFINCPIPSLCVFRVTIRLGRRPFRNKTFVGDNSSHRCHSANMNTFEPGENTEQLTGRVDKWDCAPYWGLIRTGYPENEQVRFGDNASVSWFFQYAANGYEKNLKCHKVDRLSNYDVILGFSSLCRLHLRYDDFIATSDFNVLILYYASYFTTIY